MEVNAAHRHATVRDILRRVIEIALRLLTHQDFANLAFRVIDHTAVIAEDHDLAAGRISGHPGETGLARVAGAGKVGPGGRDPLLQKRLLHGGEVMFCTPGLKSSCG